MTQAVEWAPLDHSAREPVRVGDMLSVEAGGMPIYQVVALADGAVVVADERRSAAVAMALESFRWRGVAG